MSANFYELLKYAATGIASPDMTAYDKMRALAIAEGRPSHGIRFGFKIDKSESDPLKAVIYTHDAVTMTPAYMDYENDIFSYGSWDNVWFIKNSYPVALNLDGTEEYRLDPNDYTKKSDGTSSDIQYVLQTEEPSNWSTQWKQYYTKNGDDYIKNHQSSAPTWTEDTFYTLTSTFDGNFMMAFPKIYFKRYEDSSYNYVEVSDRKLNSSFKAYAHTNELGDEVDYIYLPLFKGCVIDNKLRSLPGKIPSGNTTATDDLNAATALGTGWYFWDHSSREMICDLLTLIGRSIDSQVTFGRGQDSGYDSSDTVTYGKLPTGTLIKKGLFYGSNVVTNEVKVFGMEGFWGNRWDRILGLILADGVWKVKMTPPYNLTGSSFNTLDLATYPVPIFNNYLKRVTTSEYGSLSAEVGNGATASTYFSDYFYQNQSGTRVAIYGGSCGSGRSAGFRCVRVDFAASNSHWGFGASPIYK